MSYSFSYKTSTQRLLCIIILSRLRSGDALGCATETRAGAVRARSRISSKLSQGTREKLLLPGPSANGVFSSFRFGAAFAFGRQIGCTPRGSYNSIPAGLESRRSPETLPRALEARARGETPPCIFLSEIFLSKSSPPAPGQPLWLRTGLRIIRKCVQYFKDYFSHSDRFVLPPLAQYGKNKIEN